MFFAGQSLVEVAAHGGSGRANSFEGALWLQVRDAGAASEMWIKDPDGVPIVLVEVPPEHPIRRDSRWSEP
ncbi:glyoxalase [Mycobacteroides abscessus subsp. abscessus]|nr:glyoxalase [Mycobacteroides abscessus subsp. abscessus]